MKTLLLILALLLALPGGVQAVSVTQVMGGAVNAEVTGICLQTAGGFNMTAGGVWLNPDSVTGGELAVGVGPFDSPGNTMLYAPIMDSTLQSTITYRANANTMAQSGSQINYNAGNIPDFYQMSAHQYNTYLKQFIWTGRQATGLCTATPCLHIRAFMDSGPSTDAIHTTVPLVTDLSVQSHPTFDENSTYIIYRQAAGYVLGKFASGDFTIQATTLANNVNPYYGIAVDGGFVYAQFQNLPGISRFAKSNIGAGPTNFFPAIGSHVRWVGPTFDPNGFLYTVGQSNGINPNVIYKIRTSDMTVVSSLSMGATQFPVSSIYVDNMNGKLYYVFTLGGGGSGAGIARINRNTFLVEATYAPPDTFNSLTDSAFDPFFQAIYTASSGPGAFVAKTNLCGPP